MSAYITVYGRSPDPVLLGEKYSSTQAPDAESGSISGLHSLVSIMSCNK